MRRVDILLSAKQRAALEDQRRSTGMSLSALVRAAIDRYYGIQRAPARASLFRQRS